MRGIGCAVPQWPCKITEIPTDAPYLNGSRLLVAADCAAYVYREFHSELARDHVLLIGCPRQTGAEYGERLAEILRLNDVREIRLVRMEVGCCDGTEAALCDAIARSGKDISYSQVVIGTDGKILNMT